METPDLYIPMDRRVALAHSDDLPERTQGAALFADISGFTPLTDALVLALGPQRGAEELPSQLNRVYDALIAEVDRFGGSVIGFSGDAITCWFDGDTGLRATACALAMQGAMAQFANVAIPDGSTVALAVKIAVATGPVRRFVVGDPAIQLIDILAGETLERLAATEHLAGKGEVVLDPHASSLLADYLTVAEWRADAESARGSAVVERLNVAVAQQPWSGGARVALAASAARQWLLPPVYERLQSGLGEFLTELRPAVALFVRFGGIDYDGDQSACSRLDQYVHWVQSVIERYGGYLIQLTVGDKGSYLYAAFGAPVAHDDDAARAINAGLEIRATPPELDFITNIQIGISRGRMRTGAYGGATARTYGVLGPETNMAARLMQHAPPGEVLVSLAAQREAADDFTWEALPPLRVKGKAEPATVFRLVGANTRHKVRLAEPRYGLPMVGRERELAQIDAQLQAALRGAGQITGITAEAGMGKSRLVAETVRLAQSRGVQIYVGECQSFGTNISYLVWRPIWQAFFGLDEDLPTAEQQRQIEEQLRAIDPALVPRAPLLGVVLNLPLPDNDLTRSLDAKLRKASLEALLVDCVRGRAAASGARRAPAPTLVVLEDCHWIDPLSHDLLEAIGRAIADLPVQIVVAYRPPELERLQAPRVMQLPYARPVALTDFSAAEAARLIELKLAQLSGGAAELSPGFVEQITARAQGNPFYIEELVNYLHDRNVDVRDTRALERLELPTSLQSLILTRIDQLTESQKLTIRVASVIGRLFHFEWLWGVHPQLGPAAVVRTDLDALSRIDLTPLDQPEPELAYLFKHIVTREVAYESLPFATRAVLHDHLGGFIEQTYAATLEQYVALLAYHYDVSNNPPKKREYLEKAGIAAQAAYANDSAIDYFERLLPLLDDLDSPADERQQGVRLRLGELLTTTGRYDDALTHLDEALRLAHLLGQPDAEAQACRWIARLHELRAEYELAATWIQQGLAALGDHQTSAMAELLAIGGFIESRRGNFERAIADGEASLRIAQSIDASQAQAFATNLLGHITKLKGNNTAATGYFTQALELYEQSGNIHGQGVSHNQIANALFARGRWSAADEHYRAARAIFQQSGDIYNLAFANNNLGGIALSQGRIDEARTFYSDALQTLGQVGGSPYVIGVLHMNVGATLVRGGETRAARKQLATAQRHFAQVQSRDFLPELHRHGAVAALAEGDLREAQAQAREALDLARELEMRGEEGIVLRVLGEIAAADGAMAAAYEYFSESQAILRAVDDEYELARTQLALAELHLRQGKDAAATEPLETSIATFEQLDATLELERARQLRQSRAASV